MAEPEVQRVEPQLSPLSAVRTRARHVLPSLAAGVFWGDPGRSTESLAAGVFWGDPGLSHRHWERAP